MSQDSNRRILLIDDSPSIHEDFRKILGGRGVATSNELEEAKAAFLGDEPEQAGDTTTFELDSAHQGQEGLELLLEAKRIEKPYAMAFVDIRMPPGWDGIQTIKQLWRADPLLQVVICTAYSDYTWNETVAELGHSDRLLILKKPFDTVEIWQLAHALTDKWNTARREKLLIEDLRRAEAEARAYAASLETVNKALVTAKAAAERISEMKGEFLVHLSNQVSGKLSTMVEHLESHSEALELDAVLDGAQELMVELSEMIDFSRIEAGELPVEGETFSVASVVEGVIDALRPRAEQKGLSLTADVAATVPETIHNDSRRLHQILSELVGNAIDHTREGEVCLSASMEQTGHWDNAVLRCDVSDTGCGVAAELHGRLFEPFASKGPSDVGGHLGLGLALSKQLARLMGGDLTHEGNSGPGSTFTLLIQAGGS